MRSYKELLSFLLIREQLSLGWKILFFIVCGVLFFGSMMLMSIKVQSVDLVGTVVSHGADPSDEGHNAYLMVQLDNGKTVRVRFAGSLDYRPRRRGVVREVTTNFFGLKKYEFKGYLDKAHGE
jgi:hypothetical protein